MHRQAESWDDGYRAALGDMLAQAWSKGCAKGGAKGGAAGRPAQEVGNESRRCEELMVCVQDAEAAQRNFGIASVVGVWQTDFDIWSTHLRGAFPGGLSSTVASSGCSPACC